jgi:hypothetical protein
MAAGITDHAFTVRDMLFAADQELAESGVAGSKISRVSFAYHKTKKYLVRY